MTTTEAPEVPDQGSPGTEAPTSRPGGRRRRHLGARVAVGAAVAVAGPVAAIVHQATPAAAYQCNDWADSRDCDNPWSPSCATDDVTPSPYSDYSRTPPGKGWMVLRYSYHCGQMIFGVNDLHDRSYDSGTLVARTYKNQQIFTDTHLGPWGQYRTYDNLQSTVTAYDKSIVGVVMGWGSDNQWYKTAAY